MPSRLSTISAHTTRTARSGRSTRSTRTTPPVPAWVIIGLFSSLLLVILLTVLMATSNYFAASIVAITSTAALFVTSSIALAAHILVERYPEQLGRFVHVEVDLSSVVSRGPSFRHGGRRQQMTQRGRHRPRPDTYCDPELPPYEPRQTDIEEEGRPGSQSGDAPPLSPWGEYEIRGFYDPTVPPRRESEGLTAPPPALMR